MNNITSDSDFHSQYPKNNFPIGAKYVGEQNSQKITLKNIFFFFPKWTMLREYSNLALQKTGGKFSK